MTIATNIPQWLKTGFVLHIHIFNFFFNTFHFPFITDSWSNRERRESVVDFPEQLHWDVLQGLTCFRLFIASTYLQKFNIEVAQENVFRANMKSRQIDDIQIPHSPWVTTHPLIYYYWLHVML